MARLILIRHGQAVGNAEHRYIGCRTDVPLTEEGKESLRQFRPHPVERVYASPLLRAVQSARILYPDKTPHIVDDLRECDFGRFENRNHLEMANDAEYQAWIDSNATLPFPGGESRKEFVERCQRALFAIAEDMGKSGVERAAVVTHGGLIMGILASCALPKKEYYEWHVENGESVVCQMDPSVRPPLLEVVDDPDVSNEFPLGEGDA